MIIHKILNNNVIFSKDENDQEMIVMGRGIAFGKKVDSTIDSTKIDKVFHLKNDEDAKHAINILESIPESILNVTNEIVHYAKTVVGKPIDDIIYITLSDHINSTINRYQEGIQLKNALLWDIKQFYREEYRIGQYANRKIKEHFV